MSYLLSIPAHKGDNLGSILSLKVIRKADVEAIPNPVGSTIYGTVTFKAGITGFNLWNATADTAAVEARGSETREGSKKNIVIKFSLPKDTPGLRQMLEQATADEFIVVYNDGSGQQKIAGHLHAPMRFTFSHNTGSRFADGNFYDCQFFFEGPDNTWFYSGSVGTPPTGPANSVVNFNGSPVAVLAPGQTLNITSDFGFTSFFLT